MSDDPHAGRDSDTNPAHDEGDATPSQGLSRADVAAIVNSAITAHERRRKQAETRDDSDDIDEPKPNRKGKAEDTELARLRKQLEAVVRERDEEKARTQEIRRDTALRTLLEKRGFRSPDIAMAAVKAGLRVEEGEYVHDGEDGLPVSLDSYLDSFAKEQSWMLNPSGRPGGGAVGSSQGRGAVRPGLTPPEGLSGPELMTWARENGQGGAVVPSSPEH